MRKSVRNSIWIGLIAILIISAVLLYVNIKHAVKLKNVTLDATLVRHDTVEIKLNMVVNNPLFFNFDVQDLQYTVSLGDEELARDSTEINKTIKDSTFLQIPVTINYKKVLAQLEELRAQDSTWLDFSFFVRYELPVLGRQETTIHNTKKIPVPRLMTIKIDKVHVESFGFKNIDLDVSMLADNPTRSDITLDNLTFDVKLNETPLVEGMHWKTLSIPNHETSRFTIPIEVKTGAIAKEFFDKVTQGDKIKVYLNGSCILKMEDRSIDSLKIFFVTEGGMEI